MQLNDIYKQKWKLSPDLQKNYCDTSNYTMEEQECGYLRLRKGIETDDPIIQVNCSDQTQITTLKHCTEFEITRIEVSSAPETKDFVLRVEGWLTDGMLTVRKQKTQLTEEQRKEMRNRAKKNFNVKQ